MEPPTPAPDDAERAWIGDFGKALRRSRLPEALALLGGVGGFRELKA